MDIRIVILQRGWVMVGVWSKKGTVCSLTDAKVIRLWGTTKGLGELVLNGPTSKTALDETGIVEYHELTEVANIRCEMNPWKKFFKS